MLTFQVPGVRRDGNLVRPSRPSVLGVLHKIVLVARVTLGGVAALQGPVPCNAEERLPKGIGARGDVLLDGQALKDLAAVVRVRDGDAEHRTTQQARKAISKLRRRDFLTTSSPVPFRGLSPRTTRPRSEQPHGVTRARSIARRGKRPSLATAHATQHAVMGPARTATAVKPDVLESPLGWDEALRSYVALYLEASAPGGFRGVSMATSEIAPMYCRDEQYRS
ncbi:hypothetical protein F5Y05DRAFT_411176 [Hypoxylon sp. FL0543]|nr:hypothetical protein F5Y05DRAFT_411176 [Hypoxylon sp. FL0543]